jgi:hypothetical protein
MRSHFSQLAILYWWVIKVCIGVSCAVDCVDTGWDFLSLSLCVSSLFILTVVIEVIAGQWRQ